MPSQETIDFINRFKQYPPEVQRSFDLGKIAGKYPEIDVGKFGERFQLAEKPMAELQIPRLTSETAVAEETARHVPQFDPEMQGYPMAEAGGLQLIRGLGKGLTFGAADLAKIMPELKTPLFKDEATEIVGEMAGAVIPITGISSAVRSIGKLAGLAKAGAKLGKAAPVVGHIGRGGVAGATYRTAGQLIGPEKFDVTEIAKEAGLWAGLELGGVGLLRVVGKIGQKRTAKKLGESLKEALEAEGAPSKPIQIYEQFAKDTLKRRGFVMGEGFIMGKEAKVAAAHIRVSKKGKQFIWAPRPRGREMRPESFWPISTEVRVAPRATGEVSPIVTGETVTVATKRGLKYKESATELGRREFAKELDLQIDSYYAEVNALSQVGRHADSKKMRNLAVGLGETKRRLLAGEINYAEALATNIEKEAVSTGTVSVGAQVERAESFTKIEAKAAKGKKTWAKRAVEQSKTERYEDEIGRIETLIMKHSDNPLDVSAVQTLAHGLSDAQYLAKLRQLEQRFIETGSFRFVEPEQTLNLFGGAVSKLRSQRGAVDLSWLEKPVEDAAKTATFFKYKWLAPHEFLPEEAFRPIYDGQHALEQAGAYFNAFFETAQKAGIKPGSGASRAIWKALDTIDADKLLTEPVEGLVPRSILKNLKPNQIPFIKKYTEFYRQWAEILGLRPERRIGAYATRIREQARTMGYRDLQQILAMQGKRGIRSKVFHPFLQKRLAKEGADITEDIVEATSIYSYYGLKKAFKEPTAELMNPTYKRLLAEDPTKAGFLQRWVSDWMGKTDKDWGPIARHSDALVGRVYSGALYGNVSAALTNMTQTLTATVPEIGPYHTSRAIAKMLTKEGQAEFVKSGIMSDFMHGKKIGLGDVFTRAEFINRGVAFHAGKSSALARGKSTEEAIRAGTDLVHKTQFFLYGKVSAPEVYRRAGPVLRPMLQFTQYPLGQSKLIWSWAKNPKKWPRLAGFLGVTVALGGPQALVPADGMLSLALGQKDIDTLNEWRRKYSLSGLLGVNLAPRFGLGIFPSLAPIGKAAVDFVAMGKNLGLRILDERKIDFDRDIVQSRFVQSDIPLFIKGGVQLKKITEALGLPGPAGRYAYEKGKVIKKADRKVVGHTSTLGRVKKAVLGSSLRQAEIGELVGRTAKGKRSLYQAEREATTLAVDGLMQRDRTKIVEGMREMARLGVLDYDQMWKRIWNEVERQSLERQYVFAKSLSKEDELRVLRELGKIEKAYK